MEDTLTKLPAVILAAGKGSRLKKEKYITPKPLTPLLGLSLLERSILTCCQAGVKEFIIVVGFMKDKLHSHIEELRSKYGLSILTVENSNWESGNGTSVTACSQHLTGPFFLLMCDHLFEAKILKDLITADYGAGVCQLAVDRNIDKPSELKEATLVQIDEKDIRAIGKGIENPDAIDTGFFLCWPLLFSALKKAQEKGDGSLSGGIRELIGTGQIRAVDASRRFWHDVDTPEDFNQGEKRLLERLKTAKRIDGPVSRYINRYFSIKLTRLLAPYHITPNQVSILSTLVGLFGAACFFSIGFLTKWPPLWIWIVSGLAGFLVQISSILDGVDGEIARLKLRPSPYGAYLDYMLDRFVDGFAVMGMVYGTFMLTGNFMIILGGFMALLGLPLSSIHRAKFLAEAKRNYLDEDDGPLRYLPYSRDVRLFIVFLGGVFNIAELAIYLLAIVSNLVALLRLYTVKKAMKN